MLTYAVLLLTSLLLTPAPQARVRANPQVANPQIANPQVSRAADMFMKIEGVEGESTADGHEGWIEIESWSWAETNRASSAQQREPRGEGAGSLTLRKRVDKASPMLAEACASGRALGRVIVHMAWDNVRGARRYNEYVMDDARAVTCETTGDDRPTESVSFYYNKIEFSPAPVTPRPVIQGNQTVR